MTWAGGDDMATYTEKDACEEGEESRRALSCFVLFLGRWGAVNLLDGNVCDDEAC